MTTVGALCAFALGERETPLAGDWPPQSIAELMRHAATRPARRNLDPSAADLRELLEQGFAALDAAAQLHGGRRFELADHAAQARALFDLESGRLALSPPRAAVFIDAFLALAAEAYLLH